MYIMIKVFINGQSGTTGLRIKERLLSRDDISLIEIPTEKRRDEDEIRRCINESDITFLCLPDDAARNAVKLIDSDNTKTKIIDASTAHRTEPGWVYGFAELSDEIRHGIKTNRFIANPGCYASGFISIVYPLIRHGAIDSGARLSCFAVSGYSGGGKSAIAQYEDAERDTELDSPRLYALSQQHKHLKEMAAVTGLKNAPAFLPMICDYKCGMLVSVPIFRDMLTGGLTINDVRELLFEHYKGQKLVKVRPEGYTSGMIASNAFDGRDDMEIEVNGNEDRIVITARFDNLGKGASGAAIQNMNIACGLDEAASLVLGE